MGKFRFENKEYKYVSDWTKEEYTIKLLAKNYQNNGTLAVQMVFWDDEFDGWEPFDTLTTNLPDARVPANETSAYVQDTWVRWIEKNNIGTVTDIYAQSGFNMYVLVDFK